MQRKEIIDFGSSRKVILHLSFLRSEDTKNTLIHTEALYCGDTQASWKQHSSRMDGWGCQIRLAAVPNHGYCWVVIGNAWMDGNTTLYRYVGETQYNHLPSNSYNWIFQHFIFSIKRKDTYMFMWMKKMPKCERQVDTKWLVHILLGTDV